MLLLIFVITALYVFIIGSFIYGFDKVSNFTISDVTPKTKFSLIIPFRNESDHLENLITSLAHLNYPKSHFEILLIDDDSNDSSVELIETLHSKYQSLDLKVLSNERISAAPKKDAITLGIKNTKYDWIVTSDADCIVPKYWLDAYDSYIQHYKPNFIMGPVTYTNGVTFLDRFQILELLSLQGTTIGSFGIGKPFMCNGANLVYSKKFFFDINGFEGNTNIASGDDVFLLQKAISVNKKAVHYLKSNLVTVKTQTEPNFKLLKQQRIRWASKTTNYNSIFGKLTGLTVVIMNGLIICLPLFFGIGLISIKSLIYILFIKILIDFLLIYKSARFFEQEQFLISYIASSLFYPLFSIYVAIASVFSNYKWKGRHYSK
ncbi:glycosyltransferase family 2 protein [Psychroserpens sp.]|uniref:glycosyltransferase family 2 protein n=1 Tax=Psychroserpens sp. TaxID=2020870 RepID=UPI001B047610|nr:glycosyltransferase [Psychroserpens sp.]MBO6605691.1 glycosyltransferase [Psychroserpens sp.]MBO6630426.1 glycosyltransferase [Psychroserpens sp.]MBO6652938.1 glycosyltransferase [Psychroserpens sp.]MBO6681290.1 glycosyltransferase [Psychroserpens sp.]MBO6749065.1 glycosyltransferase [Psychroserpens sp.]